MESGKKSGSEIAAAGLFIRPASTLPVFRGVAPGLRCPGSIRPKFVSRVNEFRKRGCYCFTALRWVIASSAALPATSACPIFPCSIAPSRLLIAASRCGLGFA